MNIHTYINTRYIYYTYIHCVHYIHNTSIYKIYAYIYIRYIYDIDIYTWYIHTHILFVCECLYPLETVQVSSVQSLSRVRLFATPWIAARQASLSITNSRSLLKLTPIESVMPSSHLILCRPLLLLPPIPPSIRVFSNESTLCIRWPKYWSSTFNISPSNEHPGLISFRMDWLDLLVVQGIRDSNPYQIRRIYFIFVFSIQLKSWVLSFVKWNINNIWKYHSSCHLSFLSLFHFYLVLTSYTILMYVQMCLFTPVVKICFWQKYWPQTFDVSLSGSGGLWFGRHGFMCRTVCQWA